MEMLKGTWSDLNKHERGANLCIYSLHEKIFDE